MDQRRRFSAFVPLGRDPRPAILEANEFAREFMREFKLESRTQIKLAIVVEELASNALRHSDEKSDVEIWLSLEKIGNAVALEIEDSGTSFNPADAPAFTSPHPSTGGGVGLAIVRAWADDIVYSRRGKHNVLSLNVS